MQQVAAFPHQPVLGSCYAASAGQALAEGMVLEEDLTAAGVELAASGTRLTRGVLDLVQRRHENEPFLHGAVVRRVG